LGSDDELVCMGNTAGRIREEDGSLLINTAGGAGLAATSPSKGRAEMMTKDTTVNRVKVNKDCIFQKGEFLEFQFLVTNKTRKQ